MTVNQCWCRVYQQPAAKDYCQDQSVLEQKQDEGQARRGCSKLCVGQVRWVSARRHRGRGATHDTAVATKAAASFIKSESDEWMNRSSVDVILFKDMQFVRRTSLTDAD